MILATKATSNSQVWRKVISFTKTGKFGGRKFNRNTRFQLQTHYIKALYYLS